MILIQAIKTIEIDKSGAIVIYNVTAERYTFLSKIVFNDMIFRLFKYP